MLINQFESISISLFMKISLSILTHNIKYCLPESPFYIKSTMYQLSKINTQNQHHSTSAHQKISMNKTPPSEQQQMPLQAEYQLSPYRYINLLIYLATALGNSLPAQTFSSINSLVEDKYQISAVFVTLNTLLFPIMHPIAAFPSGWILDKFGMKIGCMLGGVLVIIGVWLRSFLAVGNPWLCLFGSLLAAFGNVFILNSSAVVAINWFQSDLVPKIIMISVLVNFFSAALGASVGGLFLDSGAQINDITAFLRWEAILISLPFIFFFIFFRENPEYPPSHAATLTSRHSDQNYKETLVNLINNREYIKIGFTASFSFGSVISFFSILNQCLTSLGYTDPATITSTTISSMLVSSIFSILISSHYVKKTKQYKKIITVCIVGSIVTLAILETIYFTLTDSVVWIILVGLLTGIFIFPINGLLIAYASDVAFPVGQGSITGYMFAFSQTFGFIIGICFISWIDRQNIWRTYTTMGLHILFFIISLGFNLSTKETLNRTNFEQERLLKEERPGSFENEGH